MKTDIQEAIQSCEERIRLYQERISKRIYKQNSKKRMQRSIHLEHVKITALRAQEEAEKNVPLTLEELRRIDGPTPLWDSGEYKPFWALVEWIPVQGGGRKLHWVSLNGSENFISENVVIEGYGTYWNYYRCKPKEDKSHE